MRYAADANHIYVIGVETELIPGQTTPEPQSGWRLRSRDFGLLTIDLATGGVAPNAATSTVVPPPTPWMFLDDALIPATGHDLYFSAMMGFSVENGPTTLGFRLWRVDAFTLTLQAERTFTDGKPFILLVPNSG